MRHLVGSEIVEHERRRHDQPPRERQHAGVRAGAPAARLVAHRNALEGDAEARGVAPARGLKLALRLALEVIADAPAEMGRRAGDAQEPFARTAGLGPDRAARAGPVRDTV